MELSLRTVYSNVITVQTQLLDSCCRTIATTVQNHMHQKCDHASKMLQLLN